MRLCRTGKHGDTMRDGIPIFFSSCGKENGHSWSKEKTLRDELTGKAVNSPKAGAGRHALPTKLETLLPAALYLNLKSVRPRTCSTAHNGVQIGHPLLLFPLPLPRPSSLVPLGVGFQRRGLVPRLPSPGGVSKGESTKAPPGADKARCFRGNGTIGGPLGPGIVLP